MKVQKIKFVLRKRTQVWKIIIFLVYFVALFFAFINLIFVICIALPVLFFCLLFLDSICWQLAGKEIIEIDNGAITVYKKGRIFQKKRTVTGRPYCVCQKEPYSFWTSFGLFFNTRGGRIKIIDDNMVEFHIGQSLSSNEAEALASFLVLYGKEECLEIPEILMRFVEKN